MPGVFMLNICNIFTRQLLLTFLLLLLAINRSPAYICPEDADPQITVSSEDSLQEILNNAESGSTICLEAGTYSEAITVPSNITLIGLETARTIIEVEDGTAITSGNYVTLRNLLIRNSNYGIYAVNRTGIQLENTILDGNTTGLYSSDSNITINHSIFHDNETGIQYLNSSFIDITNSIFSNNVSDMSSSSLSDYNNNLFYNNDNLYYPSAADTSSLYDEDPLFVDSELYDFHLKTGSPALDMADDEDGDGSVGDLGVYGGEYADPIPFPVQYITISSEDDINFSLSWSANEAFNIESYRIYFDSDQSGEPYNGSADEGDSPLNVSSGNSTTLSNIQSSLSSLSQPQGLSCVPGNQKLSCTWDEVDNATGYKLYYDTSPSSSSAQTITIDDTNSYVLTDLINGQLYYISVSALYQPRYYFSVTALDTEGNESALVNETTFETNDNVEGDKSNEISNYPEETLPYPNLGSENRCFIATATYGSMYHHQATTLRLFRDKVLLHSKAGRFFVHYYYRYGPALAKVIKRSPTLKQLVLLFLQPLVLLASLLLWLDAHFSVWQLHAVSVLSAFLFMRLSPTLLYFYKKFRKFFYEKISIKILLRIFFLTLLFTFLLSSPKIQAEDLPEEFYTKPPYSKWAYHLSLDYFSPALKEWKDSLGVTASAGWQMLSFAEIRSEVGIRIIKSGVKTESGRDAYGTTVSTLIPLRLSSLFFLKLFPSQWLVPYGGIGLDYIFYSQSWDGQRQNGDKTGYSLKAGLQFLLNPAEPDAAINLYRQAKLRFSYLFLEAIYSRRDDFHQSQIDLGGWEISSGVTLNY